MILLENFNTLHKIDKSILYNLLDYTGYNKTKKLSNVYSYFRISNNSEIYIDKLKGRIPVEKVNPETGEIIQTDESKHTWKYVTENILETEDVAGIIVRSNKRQLLGVFKRNGDYKIFLGDIGTEVCPELNSNITTSSVTNVRNKLAMVVKSYIEKVPNAKKNWDVMVIKKDKEPEQKQTSRNEARKNIVHLPKEDDYDSYISRLKDDLMKRLQKYSNEKLPNITSLNDVRNVINNMSNIYAKKIKILGIIYEIDDVKVTDFETEGNKVVIRTTYEIRKQSYQDKDWRGILYDERSLYVYYTLVGRELILDDIKFSGNASFESGIEEIANTIKRYTPSQS